MRTTIRMLCLGLLAGTPWMASAAGFDCTKAGSPVEKAICASPDVSALDGKLGDAFAAALKKHPDKAPVLRLDQQHWLAERDDSTWAFLSGGMQKEATESLAGIYKRRIAFLDALDKGQLPKPFDTLQGAMATAPALASGDVIEAVARANTSVMLAKDNPLASAKAFRLEPDDALRKSMASLGDHVIDRDLPGAPISSMYAVGGTASCISEAVYRIDGKKASLIERPPVWGDGDCMSRHQLIKVDGAVFAVKADAGDVSEALVATSRWNGKAFDPPIALDLRFDHTLVPVGSACAPKQSPCADFAKAAMAAATRYDRRPLPGTLDRPLDGKAKTSYDAALALAKKESGIATRDEYHDPVELPAFGAKVTGDGMSSYGGDATTFPIDYHGETLLGFIGHGHVGWRVNGHWLVSAWRVENGALVPVASAAVEVRRGKLLLSSVVPAPPAESH